VHLNGLVETLSKSNRIPHLIIFSSPDSSVAQQTARAFLLDWLGSQKDKDPDLIELKTTGKMGLHSVDSIRHMFEQLSLSPFGQKGKAVHIEHADRMQPAAANTLLKILEEPPERSLIALSTDASNRLLPTVCSRGQILRLPSQTAPCELPDELVCARSYEEIYMVAQKMHEQHAQEVQDDDSSSEEASLLVQYRAKAILESLYVYIRNQRHFMGKSLDPSCAISSLQKALDGLDRGGDLTTMLTWYVSQLVWK